MKKFFFKFSILLSVLSCIGFPTLAMPGAEESYSIMGETA